MIGAVAALVPFSEVAILAAFIVFLRVGAVMALLPAFGESYVPMRVRLALTIAFTMIVAPAILPELAPVTSAGQIVAPFILTEVLAGLALGILFRLMVLALQMAGQIAAQATSLSQIFASAGVEPQPAMGHLLTIAGLALLVMGGLPVKVAQAIVLSYQFLPPAQLIPAAALSELGVAQVARAFGLAMTLAMPFVIISLLYNLALGVINRAMPQLMVAMVGAPAITAGGLILLLLAMPIMLDLWQGAVNAVLAAPFGAGQ
ncbi:flagellar biosynthetic protein FliR [Actibacterium sp.]|uniref:flagellar biosynthetic protein FliR n=1 Tax=Actibacterium sp. TaxID=1872125 RepID=UPI0035625452